MPFINEDPYYQTKIRFVIGYLFLHSIDLLTTVSAVAKTSIIYESNYFLRTMSMTNDIKIYLILLLVQVVGLTTTLFFFLRMNGKNNIALIHAIGWYMIITTLIIITNNIYFFFNNNTYFEQIINLWKGM